MSEKSDWLVPDQQMMQGQPYASHMDLLKTTAVTYRHLDYSRPGGRSSQRVSDFVRRRAWRHQGGIIDLHASSNGGMLLGRPKSRDRSNSTPGLQFCQVYMPLALKMPHMPKAGDAWEHLVP